MFPLSDYAVEIVFEGQRIYVLMLEYITTYKLV